MAEGTITFVVFVGTLLTCACGAVLFFNKYRMRLRLKDELIEVMMQELPKLFGKKSSDIDFRANVKVEYDADFISVLFQCDDSYFIGNLYRYLHALRKRGYKVTANNEDGRIYEGRR